MAFIEQIIPVNTCFLVKCDRCGKTTWKVTFLFCNPHSYPLLEPLSIYAPLISYPHFALNLLIPSRIPIRFSLKSSFWFTLGKEDDIPYSMSIVDWQDMNIWMSSLPMRRVFDIHPPAWIWFGIWILNIWISQARESLAFVYLFLTWKIIFSSFTFALFQFSRDELWWYMVMTCYGVQDFTLSLVFWFWGVESVEGLNSVDWFSGVCGRWGGASRNWGCWLIYSWHFFFFFRAIIRVFFISFVRGLVRERVSTNYYCLFLRH